MRSGNSGLVPKRMVGFSKLAIFLAIACLVVGSGCTSLQEKEHVGQKDARIVHAMPQENFAEDTVLILKYNKLATDYLFQDAERAMFYAKFVLRLSQKHQWGKGKLLAYNLLSTYYLFDGSYDILRELSNESLTLSRNLGQPLYTGHAKRFMAESYSEYRHWDSARINYEQSIKIFADLGSSADSSRATSLDNMGNCYRDKKIYPKALEYYDQAYKLFDKINSDWGKATVLGNRGYLYTKQNEFVTAEKMIREAYELFKKINNRYGQLNALNDLGNIYYHLGNFDQCIETSQTALELSLIYHSAQQTNWALLSLSRGYRGKKMFEEALNAMEKVNHNRRMIHTGYVERQYTMYQLIYDNELINSEIQKKIIDEQQTVQQFLIGFSCLIIAFAAFLWFNNKKLRRKNAEIQQAMIQGQTLERKRVAAELHDHLGGTLASLNWYLYGIDKKVLSPEEQKIYDSVHQMVGAAYREVRSLSHNLMPAELEEHGLVMALNRLIGKLNENKNIQFAFNLSGLDDRLNNKIEFELYSIVLELTNNIIKHSGATAGSIHLIVNTRSIHLVVSDNGNGMAEPSGQGIGLRNIKSRVESLHGKIKILQEEPKGMKVEIEIPKTIS